MDDVFAPMRTSELPQLSTGWTQRQYLGPTPNGGSCALVLSNMADGTVVVTEYDADGMRLFEFEFQRAKPADGDGAEVIQLIVSDWDDQTVMKRTVPGLPTAETMDELEAFLRLDRSS